MRLSLFTMLLLGSAGGHARAADPAGETIRRALAYLSREVPRWSVENNCFSCHNNGDAARALYTAKRLNHAVPEQALADTTDWLRRPHDWKHNGGEGEFSDKKLAAIQFAFALTTAMGAGSIDEKAPLTSAAQLIADEQEQDGSWKIDGSGVIGGPTTYGRCLATTAARNVLARSGRQFEPHRKRADQWLLSCKPQTVLDAAAVLTGVQSAAGSQAADQRARCLDLIRRGEAPNGGWGPYLNSPPEPFDTAVVLLAIGPLQDEPGIARMIERGRQYLIRTQQNDGSWPETTRPTGAVSYAQRLSTSGWATQALLLTAATRRQP